MLARLGTDSEIFIGTVPQVSRKPLGSTYELALEFWDYMNHSWFLMIAFACSIQSFAQGFYPLQSGNVWQYYEYPEYYGWTSRATSDTLMPNGETFRVVSHDIGTSEFLRQSGSRVFQWQVGTSGQYREMLLYDFSKRLGDTVSVLLDGTDTITTTVTDYQPITFFGVPRVYWRFVTERRPNPYLVVRDVIDTAGLVYIVYEGGINYYLRGCIIAGTQYGTITEVSSRSESPISKIQLAQNYPNPFNPSTTIRYSVPTLSNVRLSVFDIVGRLVTVLVDQPQARGMHERSFVADKLPSGVYFYKLDVGESSLTRRMVFLK